MQVKVGTFTGDGTGSHAITGIGFQPDYVRVQLDSATYSDMVIRTSADGANESFRDRTDNTYSDGILSFGADGFTVGANARVNTNSSTYIYLAIKFSSTDGKTAAFTGNGVDNRDFTGVGFQPNVLWINGLQVAGLNSSIFRTSDSSFSGDQAMVPYTGGVTANLIQSLASDGFQLGTDTSVNQNTKAYIYTAFKTLANFMTVGHFTGNGTTQSITGLGFSPAYVFVGNYTSAVANSGVMAFGAGTSGRSFRSDGNNPIANGITSLDADGFSVGADTGANGSTNVMTYIAIKAGSSPTVNLNSRAYFL